MGNGDLNTACLCRAAGLQSSCSVTTAKTQKSQWQGQNQHEADIRQPHKREGSNQSGLPLDYTSHYKSQLHTHCALPTASGSLARLQSLLQCAGPKADRRGGRGRL